MSLASYGFKVHVSLPDGRSAQVAPGAGGGPDFGSSFRCPVCPKTFRSRQARGSHLRYAHGRHAGGARVPPGRPGGSGDPPPPPPRVLRLPGARRRGGSAKRVRFSLGKKAELIREVLAGRCLVHVASEIGVAPGTAHGWLKNKDKILRRVARWGARKAGRRKNARHLGSGACESIKKLDKDVLKRVHRLRQRRVSVSFKGVSRIAQAALAEFAEKGEVLAYHGKAIRATGPGFPKDSF